MRDAFCADQRLMVTIWYGCKKYNFQCKIFLYKCISI